MMNRERLINKREEIRKRYSSYLATDVFRDKRIILGRINRVLLYRYSIL